MRGFKGRPRNHYSLTTPVSEVRKTGGGVERGRYVIEEISRVIRKELAGKEGGYAAVEGEECREYQRRGDDLKVIIPNITPKRPL